VGGSLVLTCPNKSDVTLVTWKIKPNTGGHCILGYRADFKQANRTNCTENITWKSGPEYDSALQIWPVERASEGNYTCEMAAGDGNFQMTYHLTVLVLPKVSVYCDSRGKPVCRAAAGKPAARISWMPGSNSSPEQEYHGDGTVTVLSTFVGNGTDVRSANCVVSHPALARNEPIAC
ncbi:MOR1B protein, partial [Nothoprocta pentlandii]|nr:MOR1B protein [Nothoprocta pentlandii]